MFDEQPDRYEDDQPVWRRIGVPAVLVLCVCSAGALGYVLLKPSGGPAPRPHMEQHITQVQLPPPPPPPPPPKPQPEPPKKQMEKPKEQAPSPQKASVPKAAPKAPSPPAAVTTSIQGNGPGSLANGNGGGGDCIGSGCGTGDGGGGGDNDAYYSNIMKSQIEAAIRQDEKLRFARYRVKVSVVLDASGHVARASVQSFTGDADIEQELKRVLLTVGTNDTPPPDVIRKTFTISIVEHV